MDSEGRLWFATRAGVARKGENGWEFFTGDDGLPYNDFTRMAAGKDGPVWPEPAAAPYATRMASGVTGRRRWLPNDEVRSIAVDDGGTAWIATAGGVGASAGSP